MRRSNKQRNKQVTRKATSRVNSGLLRHIMLFGTHTRTLIPTSSISLFQIPLNAELETGTFVPGRS